MSSATSRAFGQTAPGRPLEALALPDAGPLGDGEVEIAVDHCSVCHSDVHLLDGDWGDVARPLVPGHEIVGRVVRAGASANISEGAVVGLGWQAGACGACAACRSEREHLCTGGKVRTCTTAASTGPTAARGAATRWGGFAPRVRADARFCFELPDGLDPTTAAPLLCAGLTVFSPLERFGVRGGARVGVVGVGGLGHLAVRFASALGASVIAFDPDTSKRRLALALGAGELADARGPLPRGVVDLLLVTTHAPLDWNAWMGVLDLEGTLCLVGVPGVPLTLSADPLLDEQKRITGSVVGSTKTMRRMLAFAAERRIAPIVERTPLSSADSVNDAVARVREGRARMRVVLDRAPR
ncbi:MAG: alcohol dehydrogenase catalytic domain-containing protein [Labilithrix sp.]|nr:alcohol dehydrogenase catalytic domain-containing protein [Labilithrix sp.]